MSAKDPVIQDSLLEDPLGEPLSDEELANELKGIVGGEEVSVVEEGIIGEDYEPVTTKQPEGTIGEDYEPVDDPRQMTREQELEHKFKLRHPTGRRKTYLKKNYKSTLAKTIKLNKANTDSTFKFRMIKVMGEKGDRRTYNAIAVVPVTSVAINPDKNFSSKQVKKIDKLIENFEKTCK